MDIAVDKERPPARRPHPCALGDRLVTAPNALDHDTGPRMIDRSSNICDRQEYINRLSRLPLSSERPSVAYLLSREEFCSFGGEADTPLRKSAKA